MFSTKRRMLKQRQENLDAALRDINAIRAEFMLPPLSELPKGRTASARDCVIARALREGATDMAVVSVNSDTFTFSDKGTIVARANTRAMRELVKDFDAHKLPELIA